MEKTILEKDLVKARKRLSDQTVLMQQAVDTLNYAEKHKLNALAKETKARLARYKISADQTAGYVSDLEKASGALPLK